MARFYKIFFIVAVFFVAVSISCKNDIDSLDNNPSNIKGSLTETNKNKNKCDIEITKIQPTYRSDSLGSFPIFEYIEVAALTSGNLKYLQLYSVYDGEKKKYNFPDINVDKGERIIIHLRSGAKEAGYTDELDDNLNESTAACAFSGERDLWDFNNIYNSKGSARLQNTSDVVILRWGDTNEYADVVPYTKTTSGVWDEKFTPIINSAIDMGIWDDELMTAAVDANGYSVTKPIQKIASEHTKNSWVVKNIEDLLSSDDLNQDAEGTNTDQNAANDENNNIDEPLNIEITKIQMKYSSKGPVFEYIELTALESGNIAGYKIYSVGNGESRAYTFPNLVINEGEKFIVHLRSFNGAIDELGSNLNEATAFCAFSGVRDLWDKNNTCTSDGNFTSANSRLADDGDVIVLCDKNNNYCDIVPYASKSKNSWSKDSYITMIQNAIDRNYWEAGGTAPSFAIDSSNCSTNAPLVKMASGCRASSWAVGGNLTKSYNPFTTDDLSDQNGFTSTDDDCVDNDEALSGDCNSNTSDFVGGDDSFNNKDDALSDNVSNNDNTNNSDSDESGDELLNGGGPGNNSDSGDINNSNKDEDISDNQGTGTQTNTGGVGTDKDDSGDVPLDEDVFNDFDDPDNNATSEGGAIIGQAPDGFSFMCDNIARYDMTPRKNTFIKNGYKLSKREGINALITEIQPTYFSKESKTVFYNEYIELYFKKGGDLSDLRIDCLQKNESIKTLTLPSVKISDGEVVVIHLTNKSGTKCVSETGNNLNLSTAPYSAKDARDIWLDKRVASNPENCDTDVLPNTLGAIILYDKSECVMDFVIYFGDFSAIGELPRAFKKITDFAVSAGLWTNGHHETTCDKADVGFYITNSKNPCTRAYNPSDDVFYTGHEAWFQNVVGGTPGVILNPE